MGLMRALQGVATGYLDARVGQFEAAAEAKRAKKAMEDKMKAEEAMRINLQNNEFQNNADQKAQEKLANRERRKNDLLNLGFTEEFIAAHGQYALGSDTNFSNFIKLGQDQYGVARWWDTPINFGNSKGMTIQEHLMQASTGINADDIKNETKNRVNIPDAIADNQIQSDEISLTKKASAPALYGKNLFFAKASRAQSEGKNWINPNTGEIINAFQYEQTIGEKNYGGAYFTTVYKKHDDGKGGEILMPELHQVTGMENFVPLEGTNGQNAFKQFNPTIESSVATSYLVYNPETERDERITGRVYTYTNGDTQEILDGISPSLAGYLKTPLKEKIIETQPPSLGFEKEKTIINTFKVDKNDFVALSDLELRPVTNTGSGDDLSLSKFSKPSDMSTSEKNQYKQNSIGLAGFDVSKSTTIDANTISGEPELNFIGKSESDKAAQALGGIIDNAWSIHNTFMNDYEISRGNRGIFGDVVVKELGLSTKVSRDIQPEELSNKVATYYKDIRDSLGKIELATIERLKSSENGEEKVKEYFISKGFNEKEYDNLVNKTDASIASNIVDRQLTEITSLSGLIDLGLSMQEQKTFFETQQKSRTEKAERAAVIKYFPPSEFEGVDTFNSFVDNYVNNPNSQDQIDDLKAAIFNLTNDEAERKSLRTQAFKYLSSDEYKEKYPYSDEATDFRTRKDEREALAEQEKIKATEEMDISSLLTTRKDGSTDYTAAIKSLDYEIPKSGIGVSKTDREENKLQPINKLIKELNQTERLPEPRGIVVRAGGTQKSPEEIMEERAQKIAELKKEIETQMVALKQETTKAKTVTVLNTPAFNPADEIQQKENIEKLKNKTMSVSDFNKLYGVGSAERFLNQNN